MNPLPRCDLFFQVIPRVGAGWGVVMKDVAGGLVFCFEQRGGKKRKRERSSGDVSPCQDSDRPPDTECRSLPLLLLLFHLYRKMRPIVAANSGVMLRVGGANNAGFTRSSPAFSAHWCPNSSTSSSGRSKMWLTTGHAQPNKMSEEVCGEQEDSATAYQHAASSSSSSLRVPPTALASETATKVTPNNPTPRSGQTVQTFEYDGSEPQFQFPLTLGPAIEDALTA